VGILVRKGNPKNIRSLADLAKENIRLLVTNGSDQVGLWEDTAGVRGLIPDLQKRIMVTVSTSAEAIERWKTAATLDAWITFESWHYRLVDVTDLVRLPKEERIYRGTPVVSTHFYKNKETARLFIDFLKTELCHAVFQKWGWE
jgi:accessory colonization factor AcfC